MFEGSFSTSYRPHSRPAPTPWARPRRVVFLLDGLDEIARRDADFPGLPFPLSRPNVVRLCAGRPEGALPETLSERRFTRHFGGSLPPMSDAGIRGMSLDGTEPPSGATCRGSIASTRGVAMIRRR